MKGNREQGPIQHGKAVSFPLAILSKGKTSMQLCGRGNLSRYPCATCRLCVVPLSHAGHCCTAALLPSVSLAEEPGEAGRSSGLLCPVPGLAMTLSVLPFSPLLTSDCLPRQLGARQQHLRAFVSVLKSHAVNSVHSV